MPKTTGFEVDDRAREILKDCNCLGRYAGGDMMAMQHRGARFFDPSGAQIVPPESHRDCTVDEIIAEYDRQGVVPLRWTRAA